MSGGPGTPVSVAERILQLLDEGSFSATYKQAVLVAILDLCFEAANDKGDPPESLTTQQIAEKVIELYWPHTRHWEGETVLVQNKSGRLQDVQRGGGIISRVHAFRVRAQAASGESTSLARAKLLRQEEWRKLRDEVEWTLIEMPLPKLQRIGGQDTSWLYSIDWDDRDRRPSRGEVMAYQRGAHSSFQNLVRLQPGVGQALRQLHGMLRPFILHHWAMKVANMNDLPLAKLHAFLFEWDRTSLEAVRAPLSALQGGNCFYCSSRLQRDACVDHFVPWSRHPDDGLHNLVVADSKCNGDKRDFLASASLVEKWRERNVSHGLLLEELARDARWDPGHPRILRVARAIYSELPEGARLWEGRRQLVVIEHNRIRRALA
ncbi:MAG: HNH endonuclease domain-containing protein [Planctomycetota bacterium]